MLSSIAPVGPEIRPSGPSESRRNRSTVPHTDDGGECLLAWNTSSPCDRGLTDTRWDTSEISELTGWETVGCRRVSCSIDNASLSQHPYSQDVIGRAHVKSIHHAVLSLLASAVVVALLSPPAPLAHVAVGTVVGVAIDLDHFPISRVRGGDWRGARRVFGNPALIVGDPGQIFAGARIDPLERLLSHALLGGALAAVTWLVRPTLGLVVVATLYVHVVADLCWDVWRLHRDPPERSIRDE